MGALYAVRQSRCRRWEGYDLELNGTMYAMRSGCNNRAGLLKVSIVGLLVGVCHVL